MENGLSHFVDPTDSWRAVYLACWLGLKALPRLLVSLGSKRHVMSTSCWAKPAHSQRLHKFDSRMPRLIHRQNAMSSNTRFSSGGTKKNPSKRMPCITRSAMPCAPEHPEGCPTLLRMVPATQSRLLVGDNVLPSDCEILWRPDSMALTSCLSETGPPGAGVQP